MGGACVCPGSPSCVSDRGNGGGGGGVIPKSGTLVTPRWWLRGPRGPSRWGSRPSGNRLRVTGRCRCTRPVTARAIPVCPPPAPPWMMTWGDSGVEVLVPPPLPVDGAGGGSGPLGVPPGR